MKMKIVAVPKATATVGTQTKKRKSTRICSVCDAPIIYCACTFFSTTATQTDPDAAAAANPPPKTPAAVHDFVLDFVAAAAVANPPPRRPVAGQGAPACPQESDDDDDGAAGPAPGHPHATAGPAAAAVAWQGAKPPPVSLVEAKLRRSSRPPPHIRAQRMEWCPDLGIYMASAPIQWPPTRPFGITLQKDGMPPMQILRPPTWHLGPPGTETSPPLD